MNRKFLEEKLLQIIKEDSFYEDITTKFIPEKIVKAKIISNSNGVISGVYELSVLFNLFNIKFSKKVDDGSKIRKGQVIFILKGNSKDILLIERTALNILSRMSGISTLTKEFIEKIKKLNLNVKIAATRKTTPLFRYFEKRAVEIGGGDTHRLGLYDMVMIKDNHLKLFNNIREALKKAKKETSFAHKIEIEVSNRKEAIDAAKFGADIIMLDNFSVKEIKKTIKELKEKNLREKIILEASGGINLDNLESYAKTGVDIISIGILTHSAKSLDFSLEII